MEVRVLFRPQVFIMLKVLLGLGIVVFGVLMIFKSEWFLVNFGTVAWAEEKLGSSGGTRLFYKLLGLALIFVGLLIATNMMSGLIMAIFGRLIPT